MSSFNQAILWLEQGKKVRRPMWEEDSYWRLGKDEAICWTNGITAHVHLNQINANDFEIYEEKPCCLSKHIFYGNLNRGMDDYIEVEDVKEFIKQEDEIGIQCPPANGSFIDGVIFAKEEMKKARHKLAGDKLT